MPALQINPFYQQKENGKIKIFFFLPKNNTKSDSAW